MTVRENHETEIIRKLMSCSGYWEEIARFGFPALPA